MSRSYRQTLLSFFPPPLFLSMPSVGIDVSDNSLKFIELHSTKDGLRVGRFGEEKIPPGIIVGGRIKKGEALAEILAKVGKEYDMHFVRATLPEESGYLFELSLPDMPPDEMASAIEFRLEENVPIAPSDAVFGYDLLPVASRGSRGKRIRRAVVSVFPRAATEAYAKLFHDAGLVPLSLETEPQAIARAAVPNGDMSTYLILDFGRERSGISIVSDGAVRFATTTDVGGDPITKAFQEFYSDLSHEQVVEMKNTKGLRAVHDEGDAEFSERVDSVVEHLLRHTLEHLRYWNTYIGSDKRRSPQVTKVMLCGGNSNLAGLPERLSQELKLPVTRVNVWVNTFSLEKHVPQGISFQESLGYAPAIGLALHGIHPVMRDRHMANLLPQQHLTGVRRERRNRAVITSLVAFFVTVLLGSVFLVPSLVLSRTEAASAERKVELTRESIAQTEESGFLVEVRNIKNRIDRLEAELAKVTFSDVFAALDRSVPSGIQLSGVSYDRKKGSENIIIRGNADTRDVLLVFTRQLDREKLMTGVTLPVSNLAKSTNITFSITASVLEDKTLNNVLEDVREEVSQDESS